GYANHFTDVWRALLLPETATSLQARLQRPPFQAWLREHLHKNTGYDRMVRELLTVPVAGPTGKVGYPGMDDAPSPEAFFFAKDLMPENLAAAASRIFLGARLECAQCHDHPFASWKRDQFWSFAAFFAGVKRQTQSEIIMSAREDPAKREIEIPNTTRKAMARFLDGREPQWQEGTSARQTLADWITRPDNAYFARATVNRLWAYFFGTGLIDPVDEMVGADIAATCPELLDDLATDFVQSGFDLKFLIQAIVSSRAYQLSSRGDAAGSQEDVKLFARMPLRGLTPEQLYDSLSTAIGVRDSGSALPTGVIVNGRGGNSREEFITRLGSTSDRPTDHQTSILHALALMNGQLVTDATSLPRGATLGGVIDAPFLTTPAKIEVLYLAALSRRPTEKETQRLEKFLADRLHTAKDDTEKRKRHDEALADMFWALLNGGEFMLNH
ncbi:MAG: DUF1553 domain-containing protein, partial [Gemmataceae bacterium]